MRFVGLTLAAAMLLAAPAAHALPGEAAAVMARCGTPTAENQFFSDVTNHEQRDLMYGDITLHFEPASTGWSFTSAWAGHMPLTREATEARMPCFREAMADVARAPREQVDPTIAEQMVAPTSSRWTMGIPFLWLMLALVAVVLVFAFSPARRAAAGTTLAQEDRPFRRPDVEAVQTRRRPRFTRL